MNCETFKNSFYGYLERQLDDRARAEFEAHRDDCPACGALYRLGVELTCRELVEALDDYVEDRMPPERRAAFDRHLSVCPDCMTFLDSYRRTMALTRALLRDPDGAAPPVLPEHLVRAILDGRRRPD